MTIRRKRVEPNDLALWRRAIGDVAPLRGRAPPHPERGRPARSEPSEEAAKMPAMQAPPQPPRPQALQPLDRYAGVDRATAERLKRGRRAIEARLDLHGLTQAEAHRALTGFVARSSAAGRRCVLVITGVGRSTGGTLRQAVPRWLNEAELRRHLVAIAPAQPRHGGGGALYLLLKRER